MAQRAYRRDSRGKFAGSGGGSMVTYGKAGGFANAAFRARTASTNQKATKSKSLGKGAFPLGSRRRAVARAALRHPGFTGAALGLAGMAGASAARAGAARAFAPKGSAAASSSIARAASQARADSRFNFTGRPTTRSSFNTSAGNKFPIQRRGALLNLK